MTGIFNGIQTLINGITTIVNGIILGIKFIINIIKSMIDLVRLLTTTLANVTGIAITLPSWLIAFVTASVGIAILYMLIGRNPGKSD